jgi:hypothetical protein
VREGTQLPGPAPPGPGPMLQGAQQQQQQAASGAPVMTILDAQRGAFDRLVLAPSCAGDHIPDAYYAALLAVQEALLAGLLAQKLQQRDRG